MYTKVGYITACAQIWTITTVLIFYSIQARYFVQISTSVNIMKAIIYPVTHYLCMPYHCTREVATVLMLKLFQA